MKAEIEIIAEYRAGHGERIRVARAKVDENLRLWRRAQKAPKLSRRRARMARKRRRGWA